VTTTDTTDATDATDTTDRAAATADAPPALLCVERGDPTAEELAALVAVVAARLASTRSSAPPAPRSEWGHPANAVRHWHRHGPGGWRAATLPC
jgi:hypothetical protein